MRGCIVSASWVGEGLPPEGEDEEAAVKRVSEEGGEVEVSGGCLLRLMSGEINEMLDELQRLLAPLDTHMQGVAPWQRRY